MMHETITAAPALARFTVDAKSLADALDYLARFVAAEKSMSRTSRQPWGALPMLAAAIIQVDASGCIVISAGDFDIQAAVTLRADHVDAPGVVIVNAETARDLAKVAPRDARVSIRLIDADRAEISHGRTVQRIQALPDGDMLILRVADGAPIEHDAATLAMQLNRLAPFVVDKERRAGALLLRRTADAFEMVSGDGNNLSIALQDAPGGAPWTASIAERGFNAFARALKAWPGGTLQMMHSGNMLTVIADRFGITMRCGDDAGWGDWREQSAAVLGTELQRTFTPDDEPRLYPEAIKRFAKGVKGFDVEIGARAARLSLPGDASWHGVTMLAPEGAVPKAYDYGHGSQAPARAYLADLMARHGIDPAPGEQHLVVMNGRAVGMTCGTYHATRRARWESVLDWETLTERQVEIVEHEEGWQEGAFSVVMPRVSEAVVSEIRVEFDDECLPLARNAAGNVYMTPEQVAKWCGPVDPSTHVAIPRAPVRRAWWKKAAPALAPKPLTGRGALMMTAEGMRDYAEACQRAADMANNLAAMAEAAPAIDPEPAEPAAPDMPEPDFSPVECVAAPDGAEVAEAIESPALPAAAPVAAPVGDELAELRAMVLAMSARIDLLERHTPGESPISADQAEAFDCLAQPAEATGRNHDASRASRRRIVLRYLAMRRERALMRAALVADRTFVDRQTERLAEAEMHLQAARLQRVELEKRLQDTEAVIERGQALIEQNRADRRRFNAVEQLLIDARARGNRLLRVAMGQRTALARVRIDLRGARAESGALRRQLAEALQPAPAPAAPVGAMADAFARAGR